MVNRHKSAACTDLPDGSTGKMCLGGGMHCPSASSLMLFLTQIRSYCTFTVIDYFEEKLYFNKDNIYIFRKLMIRP